MPKREMLRGILSAARAPVANHSPAARRWIAGSVLAILLVIFLGCMSFNIGWPVAETGSEDVLVQKGTLHPTGMSEQDVFYPIPYASPPNLTFDEMFHHDFIVVDQQPDHFRVRFVKDRPLSNLLGVEWTTRGLRAMAIKPPATGPTGSSSGDPSTDESKTHQIAPSARPVPTSGQ